MCNQGVVSLWLGKTLSESLLERSLIVEYSEDGDFLGSSFSRGFGIDYYDDSTREFEVSRGESSTLRELLVGFSYDDVIVPRFEQLSGNVTNATNVALLLYDFEYQGAVRTWEDGGLELMFFGSVLYT